MLNICEMINIAKKDEADAPTLYEKIKAVLTDKTDKKTIEKIISDEKRHYEEVSDMMVHIHCK